MFQNLFASHPFLTLIGVALLITVGAGFIKKGIKKIFN